jgi:hypothetical protein
VTPLYFMSVDWQRVPLRGDRAVVLCDQDRPGGLAFVVGKTVNIDGEMYDVSAAEHVRLAGPLRKGEQIVLWVGPHYEGQLPNIREKGNT